MAQRIKGQEVEIVMLVDGAPRENLTYAKSIDINWQTERTQEGYLGETTDRYDTVFKGVQGSIEFNFDSVEVFNMISMIVDKARRREPGTRFNIKAALNFPNGSKALIVIQDAEFGELPISFGSRSDYGTFSIDYGASEASIIPS